jgi:lipid A ethanolaminephosphotransferase
MIDRLRAQTSRFDAALLYVSDHGESLGEYGIYLHGIPYALAPREQTQVPMVLWLSEGLSSRQHIDAACLRQRSREPLSHDNLFHSLLGLSDVRTVAYRPERDLLRPCKS